MNPKDQFFADLAELPKMMSARVMALAGILGAIWFGLPADQQQTLLAHSPLPAWAYPVVLSMIGILARVWPQANPPPSVTGPADPAAAPVAAPVAAPSVVVQAFAAPATAAPAELLADTDLSLLAPVDAAPATPPPDDATWREALTLMYGKKGVDAAAIERIAARVAELRTNAIAEDAHWSEALRATYSVDVLSDASIERLFEVVKALRARPA